MGSLNFQSKSDFLNLNNEFLRKQVSDVASKQGFVSLNVPNGGVDCTSEES